MPEYFHRRNRPQTEYSGHEDVSAGLRTRLLSIYGAWVVEGDDEDWFVCGSRLEYATMQQLLTGNIIKVLKEGSHLEVFTVVELLHERMRLLRTDQRRAATSQLAEAFRLSGSVYEIRDGMVDLIPSPTTAKMLAEVDIVLSPYDAAHNAFYTAVGDLYGRRRKPDDIVKDLFVGAEGYMKTITGENDYGSAVKMLRKAGVINTMQYEVLGKLHGFRSDAHGAGHAGNSPAPTEIDALWFLELMLAQLLRINRHVKKVPLQRRLA